MNLQYNKDNFFNSGESINDDKNSKQMWFNSYEFGMTPFQGYLRAKHNVQKLDQKSIEKGIILLKRIIHIKPDFILPYVELHQAYFLLGEIGVIPRKKAQQSGEYYLQLVLQLDFNKAECYLQIARVYLWKKNNYKKAHSFLKRAKQLKPQYSENYQTLAQLLLLERKYSEAITAIDLSIELDSLSAENYFLKSQLLVYQGKYAEAKVQIKNSFLIQPEFIFSRLLLIRMLTMENEKEKAIAQLIEFKNLDLNYYQTQVVQVLIWALRTDYLAAKAGIHEVEKKFPNQPIDWSIYLLILVFREINEPNKIKFLLAKCRVKGAGLINLMLKDFIQEAFVTVGDYGEISEEQ